MSNELVISQDVAMSQLGVVLFIIAGALIYFAPSINAFRCAHPKKWYVLLANVLLGWTLLGWIGTMIWSFTMIQITRLPR